MRVEWIETRVPELQTVPDELWESVQARRVGRRCEARGNLRGRHPKYLFSGLLVCGECGSNYIIRTGQFYACSANTNRGSEICSNGRFVRRDRIEEVLLEAIFVFSPDTVAYLSKRVAEALTRLDAPDATRHRLQAELDQAWTRLENVKTAILEGIRTPTTKAMLGVGEARYGVEISSRTERLQSKAKPHYPPLSDRGLPPGPQRDAWSRPGSCPDAAGDASGADHPSPGRRPRRGRGNGEPIGLLDLETHWGKFGAGRPFPSSPTGTPASTCLTAYMISVSENRDRFIHPAPQKVNFHLGPGPPFGEDVTARNTSSSFQEYFRLRR